MLSGIKESIGNTFGLLVVSDKRNEYREKLRNAVDIVLMYISDNMSEHTLSDDLRNAVDKLEKGLGALLNGSKKNIKKARAFAVAWLVVVCATLCDRRLSVLLEILCK